MLRTARSGHQGSNSPGSARMLANSALPQPRTQSLKVAPSGQGQLLERPPWMERLPGAASARDIEATAAAW